MRDVWKRWKSVRWNNVYEHFTPRCTRIYSCSQHKKPMINWSSARDRLEVQVRCKRYIHSHQLKDKEMLARVGPQMVRVTRRIVQWPGCRGCTQKWNKTLPVLIFEESVAFIVFLLVPCNVVGSSRITRKNDVFVWSRLPLHITISLRLYVLHYSGAQTLNTIIAYLHMIPAFLTLQSLSKALILPGPEYNTSVHCRQITYITTFQLSLSTQPEYQCPLQRTPRFHLASSHSSPQSLCPRLLIRLTSRCS
jgi:hypothetical protein